MTSATTTFQRLRVHVRNARSSLLAAVFVAGVVVALGVVLDQQNSAFYGRERHAQIENDVALIQVRMRGQINADFAVVRNLANMISVASDRSPEELKLQIGKLLIQNPHFASLAIAPNFSVKTIYPEQGNAQRLDTDVRLALFKRPTGLRDSDRYATKLYGPIKLAGGQDGFVILHPVMIRNGKTHTLWGAVEAVIHADEFYKATGLLPMRNSRNEERFPHLERIAIAVRDLTYAGGLSLPFFGDRGTLDQQPVRRQVTFPGGSWEVAAIPQAGWHIAPANQTALRLVILFAGCIVVVPVFVSSLLLRERNRNIAKLESRESQLMQLSQRLDMALESSHVGIWELRDGDHSLFWDGRAAQLHGHGPEEGLQQLSTWIGSIHPDDRMIAETHFFNCSCAAHTATAQYRVLMPDGSIRHLRSVGSASTHTTGPYTTGIVWDISEDMRMHEHLRRAKEGTDIKNAELELALDELSSREQELEELSGKLELALDAYHCGIWEVNLADGIEHWDERMYQLYGLPFRNEPVTIDFWLSCLHPEDRPIAAMVASSVSHESLSDGLLLRVVHPDQSLHYVRSVGKVHTTKDGLRKIIGVAVDVTRDTLMTAALKTAKGEAEAKNVELELAKTSIEHNALHDPLTLLANRRKLDGEIDGLSAASLEAAQQFSILHIDLDRFKQINDTLGHAAGDAMLVHAAQVLAKNVRDADLVARIGGDEFVVLIKDNCDPDEMAALADRIVTEMRQPVDFEGFPCRCGVSIGIAQASGLAIDARKMLINADIALYRAKGLGRNRSEFFTHNLQAEIITTKRIADEILAGLERDEFTAWYQPQFDANTMQLTGVEALVRWNHPTQGVLTPDRFLKIADELNVVATLDRIVLERALIDKMRWTAMGIVVPKVSVNVSARRLHDEALFDSLKTMAINPGEISFELVESIFLDESEDIVSQNLERIKSLGIDIEIDDFGTGHTSIVSLLKLRPKRLKIDRQLVKPILESPQEKALVRSIIEIARSLGVETVAEGVETLEHAAVLRQLGCDLLQGYAFAKPLSFDTFCTVANLAAWRLAS